MERGLCKCAKRYRLYYDESNNVRVFLLNGARYNIDNDPNQSISPVFVLAGIALALDNVDVNFEGLKESLCLQDSSEELKFDQMVTLRARFSPVEAFKYVLGGRRFNTLFKWLLDKKVYVHYYVVNTVHWSFLDIIEDLVLYLGDLQEEFKQYYYKDCLYALIKLDKHDFLSLMTEFNYPRIDSDNGFVFLERLYGLVQCNVAKLFNEQGETGRCSMLLHLGLFFYKCLNAGRERIEFTLVFNGNKNVLIEEFSPFYLYRIKTFPQGLHVLDNENDIEERMNNILQKDAELSGIGFAFVESKLDENLPVQISDVIAGLFRVCFAFLESASDKDIDTFAASLSYMQKKNFDLFKRILMDSSGECDLFHFRTIVPSDEKKLHKLLQLR